MPCQLVDRSVLNIFEFRAVFALLLLPNRPRLDCPVFGLVFIDFLLSWTPCKLILTIFTEAIFIKECDASWTSAGRGPRGVLNCDDFASRKYCTASGEKGDGWKGYYGSYNHRLGWWTDEAGRTCLVCPQCGCGKSKRITLTIAVHFVESEFI